LELDDERTRRLDQKLLDYMIIHSRWPKPKKAFFFFPQQVQCAICSADVQQLFNTCSQKATYESVQYGQLKKKKKKCTALLPLGSPPSTSRASRGVRLQSKQLRRGGGRLYPEHYNQTTNQVSHLTIYFQNCVNFKSKSLRSPKIP
jgi:hypothetical protein